MIVGDIADKRAEGEPGEMAKKHPEHCEDMHEPMENQRDSMSLPPSTQSETSQSQVPRVKKLWGLLRPRNEM